MMATKIYKSEVLASIHEMMEGAYETGAIDKKTMSEFDESCLIAAPVLKPEEFKATRESESVSQPVFARYHNVSKNLVSERERGVKRPGELARWLLSIVRRKRLEAIV